MSTDPGYGPNGERLDPPGAVVWSAAGPPQIIPEVDDRHGLYAYGLRPLPFIDQNDDDAWAQNGPLVELPLHATDTGIVDLMWDDGDNAYWDDGDNLLWDA